MPKKSSQIRSPGPADYVKCPLVGYTDHSQNSLKPRAPQWTIGEKLGSKAASAKSPGPSTYDVKSFNQHGKYCPIALSIPIKFKSLSTDKTPGPTYNATDAGLYRWKYEPKFTMPSLLKTGSNRRGPGPATYEPTSLQVFKQNDPRFTIRQKGRNLKTLQTPGPKYDVGDALSKTMQTSPAFTHRWRNPDNKKMRTPGANAYDLTKYNPFSSGAAFTMSQKAVDSQGVKILPSDNC